jgi:hypothetical protein
VLKSPALGLGRTAGLKKRLKSSSWGSPRGSGVHLQWEILCEWTNSYKPYEREEGKVEQGENILLRELFKGTAILFAVEKTFA